MVCVAMLGESCRLRAWRNSEPRSGNGRALASVLEAEWPHLYIVHMKRVTASEARKHWFRLLDEVIAGEVVVTERKGRRVVLKREEAKPSRAVPPDYRKLLRVPDAEHADLWSWRWAGPGRALKALIAKRR